MEQLLKEYFVSTDKSKIDIEYVHNFLRTSYWAENISFDVIKRAINGSLCFSVFHLDKQVGFARVITDTATFAYLADVFIDPNYRGKGLSKLLMKTILKYPDLQRLRRFMLATKDAHGLYEQFSFKPITNPERYMVIHKPDVYKENRK
ncbi:MAG TPA: GNAT family N-acetyltransferase [Flavisolibacter sp.]|nr:GNAT family N-acetyltransferase [Flavisolibacter sp.]